MVTGKEFDFKILSSLEAEEMETKVKTMLKEGWELHGDLKAVPHNESGNVQYIQALVKDITPRGRTGFRTSMQE